MKEALVGSFLRLGLVLRGIYLMKETLIGVTAFSCCASSTENELIWFVVLIAVGVLSLFRGESRTFLFRPHSCATQFVLG